MLGQQAVASKVKMSGREKIKAGMNTGNKIFGSTYDNSAIKIICSWEVCLFYKTAL